MQKVNVQLFNSFPEILVSASGVVKFKFDNHQPNTSGKLYTFYNNDCVNLEAEVGSVVICQVKNTMTVGVVREILEEEVSDVDFFQATLERSATVKNGYRLILAVIDNDTFGVQMRFKHLYEKKKLENESRPKVDMEAFNFALYNL